MRRPHWNWPGSRRWRSGAMRTGRLHAEHFLRLFKQTFPDGQVHHLAGVSRYSPEDAPDEVAQLVSAFMKVSK